MIVHIALFRWKKQTSDQEIDEVMKEVEMLKEKIPEIVSLYCGRNFSQWAKGYSHAIVITFNNREDLKKYRKNPNHIPIANKIEQLADDSLGFDFEN